MTAPASPPGEGPRCYRRGACCQHSPGWFGPGEAERAAELLGLQMGDFATRYLVLDSARVDDLRIEVFVPVKVDAAGVPVEGPNVRISRVYHLMDGRCVFYDAEGKACRIHAARPVECRHYFCEQPEDRNLSKQAIARMWLEAARRYPGR